MNKNFLALGLAAALLAPQVAGAEGFGINEWSAEGVAMGGARMFAEDDAANVAYNPASITKVKGEVMKSSYTYLSPHGNYKLYDGAGKEIEDGKNVVHAGWAVGSYYVRQINDKEWFGIGAFPRFAMVSEFERASKASTNAFFSKLNGVSVTPTYAHKFDKKMERSSWCGNQLCRSGAAEEFLSSGCSNECWCNADRRRKLCFRLECCCQLCF